MPERDRCLALTHDGALVLVGQPAAMALAGDWIPPGCGAGDARAASARIDVACGDGPAADAYPETPIMALGGVRAYDRGGHVLLRGADGSGTGGRIDLAARRAEVTVRCDAAPGAGEELAAALTLAAALLIGRLGGALVHGAAVVEPGVGGRAWVLVGDSHAGKTTTCATLLRGGWQCLSDDQVVVRAVPAGIEVEGWPRQAQLDTGWTAGRVNGVRAPVELQAMWPGQWRRTAALGGVWLPAVRAGDATRAETAGAGEVLAALVRQSPWLLADAAAAPEVLQLLSRVAELPALRLSLGSDGYGRAGVILSAMGRQAVA